MKTLVAANINKTAPNGHRSWRTGTVEAFRPYTRVLPIWFFRAPCCVRPTPFLTRALITSWPCLPCQHSRAMAPKPKPKPTGRVEVVKHFVRGHAARNQFFDSLAAASTVDVTDVKRVFDSIQKIAVRELRAAGTFTLHTIGSFRVKTLPATPEGPGECHGMHFTRREKPSKKCVVCKVAAPLNDKAVN